MVFSVSFTTIVAPGIMLCSISLIGSRGRSVLELEGLPGEQVGEVLEPRVRQRVYGAGRRTVTAP